MDNTKRFLILIRIHEWFASWKFPVLAISLLFFFVVLVFSIWLIPPSNEDLMGKFAKSFRIWCFGQNPELEKDQDIYMIMFILDPLLIIGILYFFWNKPLKEVIQKKPKELYLYIFYGILPVIFSAGFFLYLAIYENPEFNFKIQNFRIQVPIENIELVDHRGKKIQLYDFRENVIVITSFYSHCYDACPFILKHTRDIVEKINDKTKIKVLAITMDPERDTVDRLKKISEIYQMKENYYYFLTGDKKAINHYLDKLDFSRKYDEKTGHFNHANIILLIDKKLNLSFRFSTTNEQKKTTIEAIHHLLLE
ncbi:MAG: SCO family protein [Leptonema sp. (in: bacteria)]